MNLATCSSAVRQRLIGALLLLYGQLCVGFCLFAVWAVAPHSDRWRV